MVPCQDIQRYLGQKALCLSPGWASLRGSFSKAPCAQAGCGAVHLGAGRAEFGAASPDSGTMQSPPGRRHLQSALTASWSLGGSVGRDMPPLKMCINYKLPHKVILNKYYIFYRPHCSVWLKIVANGTYFFKYRSCIFYSNASWGGRLRFMFFNFSLNLSLSFLRDLVEIIVSSLS